MHSESVLNVLDRFIKKTDGGLSQDTLIKSRIFVLAGLLIVAISLNDLGRLAYAGQMQSGFNELMTLVMGGSFLILHYYFGRPQYLIIPLAFALVALLFGLYILPSRSFLAPSMQWIPLITGCVFFISGRPLGWAFGCLMLLLTIGTFAFRDFSATGMPSDDILRDFQHSMPIVLAQVLASSFVMVLVYLNQHKRARVKLLALQHQMAQAIKSSENNDFSFSLGCRINQNLKPVYRQFFDPGASSAEQQESLQRIRSALLDMKDYMQLLRSVQETASSEQSGPLTWLECLRRARCLIPGRHGLMVVAYDETPEDDIPYPFEARIVPIMLECVRYLCYRSMAAGRAQLKIRAQGSEQGLTILFSLHPESTQPLTAEQSQLIQQKQELCIRFLRDELRRMKGTVQSQRQDQVQWLQVTLPMQAETSSLISDSRQAASP